MKRIKMNPLKAFIALVLAFCTAVPGVYAELMPPTGESPYTYIPEGRPLDVDEYRKPSQMLDIVPNRPVVAHDKNGNRLYFTPAGKLSLRVSNDGKQEFSLRKGSVERDATGKITGTSELMNDTGKWVKKNEKGQAIGYSQTGFGGKTIAEYDFQGNLTKTTQYNRYGKSTEYVMDVMSQSRTVFDDKGRMTADVNFEGHEIAWYEYDDKSRLTAKVDGYGNRTMFNKQSEMTQTVDFAGRVTATYNYRKDEEGRSILASVKDEQTGNVTYYENSGRVTKNAQGEVVKDYYFEGSVLTCTFDREKQETTWYDLGGKPLYTTYNDILVSQWLYYNGKQVGMWDQSDNTITVYKNQREEIKIKNPGVEAPTAETIEKWVTDGIIEDAKIEHVQYMQGEPWKQKPDLTNVIGQK